MLNNNNFIINQEGAAMSTTSTSSAAPFIRKKYDTMTVRELIQELQQLDQDKGIWIIYDASEASAPLPDDEPVTHYEEMHLADEDTDIHEGDYKISVG